MKLLVTTRLALVFVLAALSGCNGKPVSEPPGALVERILVGQLLLPNGPGSRGVEVQVLTASGKGEPRAIWVLFDEEGHFSHSFREKLSNVKVTAGIGWEIYGIDAGDLPKVNQAGQIDVGTINLRDHLMRHHLKLSAADGKPEGDVRVAMWLGLPPVGPSGEPVSLGSRQFPPVALGSSDFLALSRRRTCPPN